MDEVQTSRIRNAREVILTLISGKHGVKSMGKKHHLELNLRLAGAGYCHFQHVSSVLLDLNSSCSPLSVTCVATDSIGSLKAHHNSASHWLFWPTATVLLKLFEIYGHVTCIHMISHVMFDASSG